MKTVFTNIWGNKPKTLKNKNFSEREKNEEKNVFLAGGSYGNHIVLRNNKCSVG